MFKKINKFIIKIKINTWSGPICQNMRMWKNKIILDYCAMAIQLEYLKQERIYNYLLISCIINLIISNLKNLNWSVKNVIHIKNVLKILKKYKV